MNRKAKLLQDAGYRYNYDRMAYVNRDAKKIFAVDDVENHSEAWLADRIAEPNPSGGWLFYEEPSPGVAARRRFDGQFRSIGDDAGLGQIVGV